MSDWIESASEFYANGHAALLSVSMTHIYGEYVEYSQRSDFRFRLYLLVDKPILVAGCRSFFSIDLAINYWSGNRCRPDFALALQALRAAIERREVIVTDDDGRARYLRVRHDGELAFGGEA